MRTGDVNQIWIEDSYSPRDATYMNQTDCLWIKYFKILSISIVIVTPMVVGGSLLQALPHRVSDGYMYEHNETTSSHIRISRQPDSTTDILMTSWQPSTYT